MEITVEQQIRCTPEHAFDTMADARNETRWNSLVSRVELRSGEPVGPGSEFLIVNRGQPYDVTVTTYERPSSLRFEARGETDLTIAYTFAPAAAGTAYRAAYDFRAKGFARFLLPLLRPVVGRSLRKETASFAALCERG